MPFETVGELEMYFELKGDPADVPVVHISGSGNDLRRVDPGLLPLNDSFHVLHFDQRGLGQTASPDGQWEMADYAKDAAGLIRSIGWERCHVVGTSFGGMVAQHLAIAYPELVDRLVLNCTSPGGSHPSFPLHTLEQLDLESRIEMRLGLFDNRWDPGADDPIPGLGKIYDLMIAAYRTEQPSEARDNYLRQLDARSRHDTTRRLGEIESPTLVCAGEFDDLAPPLHGQVIADEVANATMKRFDGGHLFLLQDPTAWQTIVSFLSGDFGG